MTEQRAGGVERVRVAAAAYPAEFVGTWAAFEAKVSRWVADAARRGAQLLVFPEYAPLELISLLPPALRHDVRGMRGALQVFLPEFRALHARLAREFGVGIVAGSYPVASDPVKSDPAASDAAASDPAAGDPVAGAQGRFVNRAYVFGPDGTQGHQDKLLMTRFEAEEWDIAPGEGVRVFDLPLPGGALRFGVAVCYDSEFPHLARAQAEAGAELLVVPSFTGSRAGFTRVRVGSMARALENQLYAVHAPLIADAPWTYAVEDAHGAAGVYAPSDNGLPEDGIVAQLGWNEPGWLVTDLDLTLTRHVRADGHVLNWRDRHVGVSRAVPAQVVSLDAAQEPV